MHTVLHTVHLESGPCTEGPSRSSFIKSTTSALIKATNDWLTQLEEGNEVAAIFFEAFDSVPYQHLLQKLVDINLDPFLIAWISDYLTDRKQRTVLSGSISRSLPVTSGVPQGSVLGPLLFIIFMSDINSVNLSHESKLLLCADDILLYRSVTSRNDYKFSQEDIHSLSAWCNSNHLTFNEQKCKSMVASRKRERCVLPTFLPHRGV